MSFTCLWRQVRLDAVLTVAAAVTAVFVVLVVGVDGHRVSAGVAPTHAPRTAASLLRKLQPAAAPTAAPRSVSFVTLHGRHRIAERLTANIAFVPRSRAAEGTGVAGDVASNAANAPRLARQLASESQVAGEGTAIGGAGTSTPHRVAGQLAADYGGVPGDYAKMTSSNFADGLGPFDLFETHWYENVTTGARYEFKTKFPRAESFLGGGQ